MPKNKHKNRYAAYNERIQAFADSAIKTLNKRLGNSIPEYTLTLVDQACETLDLIGDCKKSIKTDGMLIDGERGNSKKLNPSAQMMNVAQNTLNRILVSLLLTPNAIDKQRKSGDKSESLAILDDLLNGGNDDEKDYDEDGE